MAPAQRLPKQIRAKAGRNGGAFSGSFNQGGGGGVSYTDDAPAVQSAIASSGSTYTLPNRTLYFPNGLSLSGIVSKTITANTSTVIVLGQQITGWSALTSGDANYSAIPTAARSSVLVASAPFLSLSGHTPNMDFHMGTAVQNQTVWPAADGGTYHDGWLVVTASGSLSGGAQTLTYTSDSEPGGWGTSRYSRIVVEGWPNFYQYAYGTLSSWTSGLVTLANFTGISSGGYQGGTANCRFRYRNILEELNGPGQYYVDFATKQIYWYPPASYTTNNTFLSTSGAINISGCSSLTIQGSSSSNYLPIIGGAGNAVSISATSGVTLDYVSINNPAGFGISATDHASTSIVVNNCDVVGCGKGAFFISGGNRLSRTASNNLVENSFFSGWARQQQDSWNTLVGMAPTVNNCYFTSSTAMAIDTQTYGQSVPNGQNDGANDALIENSIFDTVGTGESDEGAIYFGHNWGGLGNQATNNIIRNVQPYVGQGSGQSMWGVYFDDSQACAKATGNTMQNCWGGVLIGGGWANTFSGNLLSNVKWGVALDYRTGGGGTPGYQRSNVTSAGITYGSVTQWFTWGSAPSNWKTAYDNFGGTGQGLSAMMALYSGGVASTGYGSPLWTTIDSNNWYNAASGGALWINAGAGNVSWTTSNSTNYTWSFPECSPASTNSGTANSGGASGVNPRNAVVAVPPVAG